MTEEQYLEWGGLHCPVCHSTNIDAERIEPDADGASCKVTCFSCDSIWLDVYKLAGIDIIKRGKQ